MTHTLTLSEAEYVTVYAALQIMTGHKRDRAAHLQQIADEEGDSQRGRRCAANAHAATDAANRAWALLERLPFEFQEVAR
ncbi:MAG: hypothetical protein A2792_01125 [Sphingomonadales bacterium RIFCSPHIGHO2_01_FULL_65_20]|nr:MAG: hypothetical protein A2792_01125 [Sphingomonadales bacterium RIFCSPHIGHO2_01_FULL_65_20]